MSTWLQITSGEGPAECRDKRIWIFLRCIRVDIDLFFRILSFQPDHVTEAKKRQYRISIRFVVREKSSVKKISTMM